MTLWDKTPGLILGLALFTFACEEPGEIGLEINPENGDFVVSYFEIPIENTLIQYEDILSDNATRINFASQSRVEDGRLLIGNYNTPEFGTLNASAYSNFYFGKYGFHPEGYAFDSLVLHVKVNNIYGDNFSGVKRIKIHELSEEIKLDSIYLTKNSTPYLAEPVGEFNFEVSVFDTIFVDTVFTTRLADELGMRLFDKAQTDTIIYNDRREFRKFFNGLAFVSDESNDMVTGIHAESQSTYMRMHFHDAEDTIFFDFTVVGYTQDTVITEKKDTLYYPVNLTRYYNNISLDRTGSAISGIPGYYTDFETDDNYTYVQASSGIFTKLNFGEYFNFLDTIDNLVINRAEIVMPVKLYVDYLQPSVTYDLYLIDENNRFKESINADSLIFNYEAIGPLAYSGFKDENRGEIVGNITSYIQALTSGEYEDVLILVGQSGLEGSVLSVNQAIIEKDKILLRVYYSSLK
jgi:hypothetical protein